MRTSKNARIEELKRLKKEFNTKLKDSFERYESRMTQYCSKENDNHKTDKSISSIELNKDMLPVPKKNKKKKLLPDINSSKKIRRAKSLFKKETNTWKPPYMICDYFEKFKRLQDKHEMNNWEIVNL